MLYFLTAALIQWSSEPTWGWHEGILRSLERWGAPSYLRICGGREWPTALIFVLYLKRTLHCHCHLNTPCHRLDSILSFFCNCGRLSFWHFPTGLRRQNPQRLPPTQWRSHKTQPANYPKISFIARKVSYLIHRTTKTNKTKTHKFFLTNTWLQIYTVSFFRY